MAFKSAITRLFAPSPVRPLQQHMERVQLCVQELEPFFQAVAAGNMARATEIQKEIAVRENAADDLKHKLRGRLPRGLLMPMSREQVLEVLTMQDKIANMARDIAGVVVGREMKLPEPLAKPLARFVRRCVETSAQARGVVDQLDELVSAGFRGGAVQRVEKMIDELHQIERETDKLERRLRRSLFAIEADYSPVDVVFWYRIIDWIGEIADLGERVGNRLQLMLAR